MKKSLILTAALTAVLAVAAQNREPSDPRAFAGLPRTDGLRMLQDCPTPGARPHRDSRDLKLDFDISTFFFDAEYSTPLAKGFTATGMRLSPALRYNINERAHLRLGLCATVMAGLDSLHAVRPIIQISYSPTRWLTLVGGTLHGGLSHDLGAPAYDPSRWVFDQEEEGLQILTDTRWWKSDTWVDWEHYLRPWTPDQERFTMGSQHIISILKDSEHHTFSLGMPLHFLASHRGGEWKTIDTNTVTTFNERVGLRATLSPHPRASGFGNWLSLDASAYFYHLEDTELDNGGWGLYPTLSYEARWMNDAQRDDHGDKERWTSLHATVGLWHGNHYFSALGSPLFWSATPYALLHTPTTSALPGEVRDLLTLRLALEHEYHRLSLGLQTDLIYDLSMRQTDLQVGFFMRFRNIGN